MSKHYIPITKVDEEQRLVYMRAASETTDHSGESMDYGRSKANFEKWSNDAYTRSAGKSYGNIREMHTSIAAGKLNEPLIFDDENKTVDIVVYVSDDGSWQKVKDGVLTGASIGGSYEEIKFDPVLGVKRYVADLTEISLVDAPCNPDAVIEVVKANGVIEMRKVVSMKKTLKDFVSPDGVSEELKKSFSFDDVESRVKEAIRCRIKENTPTAGGYSYGYSSYYDYGYFYSVACYDDSIVISGLGKTQVQVYYTIDGAGVVTLGEARQVHLVPEECSGDASVLELLLDRSVEALEKAKLGGELSKNVQEKVNTLSKMTGGKTMNEDLKKAVELITANLDNSEVASAMVAGLSKTTGATAPKNNHYSKATETEKEDKAKEDNVAKKDDTEDTDDEAAEDEKKTKKTVKKAAGDIAGANGETALAKALGSIDNAMNALLKSNEALVARVVHLESQPTSGGPVVTAVEKSLGGAPMGETQVDPIDNQINMLKSIQAGTSDMQVREALSRQMASLEMTRTHSKPIVFNS